jgi:hypothetical protein
VDHNAIPGGRSNAQRTVIRAAQGETVIVNGRNSTGDVWSIYDRSFITVEGITMDGSNAGTYGLRIGRGVSGGAGAHYITIQNGAVRNVPRYSCVYQQGPGGMNSNLAFVNLQIANCGDDSFDHGIYLTARDSVIEGCNIHDNTGHGIHNYISGGGSSNNVIRFNEVYRNGSFGILIGSGSNNVAYSNVVRHNGRTVTNSGGIWTAYYGNSNNRIYNNTIYSNGGTCIRIRTSPGVAKNNLCWRNTSDMIVDETGRAVISNNMFTNPSFRSIANNDFSLLAASGAIDAGVSVGEVGLDFARVLRPQGRGYDIGAFEFEGTVQSPSAPTGVRVD